MSYDQKHVARTQLSRLEGWLIYAKVPHHCREEAHRRLSQSSWFHRSIDWRKDHQRQYDTDEPCEVESQRKLKEEDVHTRWAPRKTGEQA